jgi:hypothetical protein
VRPDACHGIGKLVFSDDSSLFTGIERSAWVTRRPCRNVVDGPLTTFPNVVNGPLTTLYCGEWAIHRKAGAPRGGELAGYLRLLSAKTTALRLP